MAIRGKQRQWEKEERDGAYTLAKEKASTVGIIQEDISKVTYDEGTVLIEASYIPPDVISKKMQEEELIKEIKYYLSYSYFIFRIFRLGFLEYLIFIKRNNRNLKDIKTF